MLKRCKFLVTVLVTAVMLLGLTTLVMANEDEGRDIEELRNIIADMIIQRDAANPLGADSRLMENLHLHPNFLNVMTGFGAFESDLSREVIAAGRGNGFDARLTLLWEIQTITNEAVKQVESMDAEHSNAVIRAVIGPHPRCQSNFVIHFSNERYFNLVDIVSDFTGIPKYMLRVGVMGPIYSPVLMTFDCNPLETFVDCDVLYYEEGFGYEEIAPQRNRNTLAMGIPIQIRMLGGGTLHASMGHSTNATGRFVYTTSHGVVTVGSGVYVGNLRVGIVRGTWFEPSVGLDVSRIELLGDFYVSNMIRGIASIYYFPNRRQRVCSYT